MQDEFRANVLRLLYNVNYVVRMRDVLAVYYTTYSSGTRNALGRRDKCSAMLDAIACDGLIECDHDIEGIVTEVRLTAEGRRSIEDAMMAAREEEAARAEEAAAEAAERAAREEQWAREMDDKSEREA